jgi:hypothetical protein
MVIIILTETKPTDTVRFLQKAWTLPVIAVTQAITGATQFLPAPICTVLITLTP